MRLDSLQQAGKLPKTKKPTKYHTETMARTSGCLLQKKREETCPMGQCHDNNPDPRGAASNLLWPEGKGGETGRRNDGCVAATE